MLPRPTLHDIADSRFAHLPHEGDTVRFRLGNGEAEYRLRRDLPKHGRDGIVAELIEGTSKASLASRRRKYEAGG